MKTLFLDMDGVCNSEQSFRKAPHEYNPIDPYMAFLVGKIQLQTGCQVVLSSAWRHHADSIKIIEQRVVKLFDKTPASWYDRENDHHSTRGEEIQKWLDAHPEVTRYAILDDDSDMLETQKPNFFKTSWEEGLTQEIAEAVITHLNS